MIKDYNEIIEALNHYVNGAVSGSSEEMKQGIHKDATMFGYFQGVGFMDGPIQNLYDFADDTGPAKSLKSRIDILDITETAASARIIIEDWNGVNFTDYMNLLKVDGEWKLINKIFHHHSS